MSLPKRYNPQEAEARLLAFWQELGIYHFSPDGEGAVFSIDTPPPTVSGNLHLGHVYSYSHPDFVARFKRMNGYRVYYPMGYDDNGLPTERLVERRLGVTAQQVGRAAFIEKCLEVSEQAEKEYQELWQRLGLSIDWRYTYRTVDDISRRISQWSFLDLYRKNLLYRSEAPTIWCPECHTAIAQAELNDLERMTEFVTLKFSFAGEQGDGSYLPIATTRPELLPACVAVFVHPQDNRFKSLVGQALLVPLFGQVVPVLEDAGVDPEKGTGAVMCCTFGDTADVTWWRTHQLPLIQAIDRDGRMTQVAGAYSGLPLAEARRKIKSILEEKGLLLERKGSSQSVRVHERCDTTVEYVVSWQWFIRLLEYKEALREAGERINWYPEHMQARYRLWVENLNWDWCISRQRYFGVPFPVWYCRECGEVILADEDQLPVDPLNDRPSRPCTCGSSSFIPEEDIFDTWATSSMTPQIAGGWPKGRDSSASSSPSLEGQYGQVYPYSLRPQAHEIIRTWAFYTIAKSQFHFEALPWKDVLISGWGLAGEGMGKISKSRGGGPMSPLEMIARYSADAVRYWAASTGPGKDSVISEEKIQMGAKLVTKLWNVARFCENFVLSYQTFAPHESIPPGLTPADRWILSRLQSLARRVTESLGGYDYAAAKSEIETFFWRELADNYLEMGKQRLYDPANPGHKAARFTLYHVLLTTLKLLAPFLPYVTEEIYQELFAGKEIQWTNGEWQVIEGVRSIHLSRWPEPVPALEDGRAEALGEVLVKIATAVRRYKSERKLALGSEIDRLQLATTDKILAGELMPAIPDLMGVTRARQVEVVESLESTMDVLEGDELLSLGVYPVR